MGFLQEPADRTCPLAAAVFGNLLEMFSFWTGKGRNLQWWIHA
jgi:hypothetical protein